MDTITLLNHIIQLRRSASYLEICRGTRSPFHNIALAQKVGVDPVDGRTLRMTPDRFFEVNQQLFDLVHIGAGRLYEDALAEIHGALQALHPNGVIVLGGVLPRSKADQERVPTGDSWCGDVWKAVVQLQQHEGLDVAVLDASDGFAIILPRNRSARPGCSQAALTWEVFRKQAATLLPIIQPQQLEGFLAQRPPVDRPPAGPTGSPEPIANPLFRFVQHHEGRKTRKWLPYFDVYHHHFERFRFKKVNVLEIGVQNGGSLQLWQQYFGPRARIFGIDLDSRCKAVSDGNIQVFIGDQADPDFLQTVLKETGQPDIIIDDGGHHFPQQQQSFEFLFPRLSETGVYLIEDVHTSYMKKYGGHKAQAGTFIEYVKTQIDSLHAWRFEDPTEEEMQFARSTFSVSFYESICVFEKRPMKRPGAGSWGQISIFD